MKNLKSPSIEFSRESPRSRTKEQKADKLRRRDWVIAARQALVKEGISGVSLRKLASSLGATTGAFYWQYNRLEDLLEDVREDWVHRNTDQITKAFEEAGPEGWQMYLAYTRALILEDAIDDRYDNAIREWAHSSKRTAEVLRHVEEFRIEQLRNMFVALGFKGKSALIRARVMYFHQTGYYAMQIVETKEERLENVPYYAEILVDRLDMLGLKGISDVRRYLERQSDACD
ncbi:TetR/AcrR family transcriptional regulator [uncultured Roseovarius sp.]|uniref:TetR/AcrR family transcriptional regulator n=1 Tax=uncultured Roseovarius sp. TaxID=293344 RepID=UPI002637F1BF|nr:TetR/AcrR family transcriptional regulator [uncultured Roseovarius sp.]